MNPIQAFYGCAAFAISLALATPANGAVIDELRISQLEQEVRELQRLAQQQARRIDALENSLRQAGASAVIPPSKRIVEKESAPQRWLDAANWDRLKVGMSEAEILRLLGTPTTIRSAQAEGSRTLLYAMELDGGGFLSGQVVIRDQRLVEAHQPALK